MPSVAAEYHKYSALSFAAAADAAQVLHRQHKVEETPE
jgi:hypothetical protein